MSDINSWSRKMLVDQFGIFVAEPTIVGLVEAEVTQVGTSLIAMSGQPAQEMPTIMFRLPNTYGEGPGFGPAAYQPVSGWTPSPGDPCLVMCTGNGVGRPYVVAFPTATPS